MFDDHRTETDFAPPVSDALEDFKRILHEEGTKTQREETFRQIRCWVLSGVVVFSLLLIGVFWLSYDVLSEFFWALFGWLLIPATTP